jgi:uracil-DNA glycosylase
VGSNPSTSSVDNSAFHKTTRSAKILAHWLSNIKTNIEFTNVCDKKTYNNKTLSTADIRANLTELKLGIMISRPTHIVALGKTAEKALTLLQLNFYAMPHPSGRNRMCNDKNAMKEKIKGLELFVQSPNLSNLNIFSSEELR